MTSVVLLIAYGGWSYFLAGSGERLLLDPIFLSAAIVLAMVEYFWRRDRQLPIVDVGALCALITLVYMALPAIFYIKAGFVFGGQSDARLTIMKTTAADVADFLWYVTAYITALCVAYSLLRGPGMPGPRVEIGASPGAGWALAAILALALIYQIGIEHAFHVHLDPTYQQMRDNLAQGNNALGTAQLPLLVAQISHNVLGIGRIAKLGIIAFVFARKNWALGFVLAAWLVAEGYSTVVAMSARTYFVVLIMAAILSGHRLLRPIGPVLAAVTAVVLIVGVLGFGYVRQGNITSLSDLWLVPTEFQSLMASGISISWQKARGNFHDVPWQIIFSDLVLMIPQQLLPFPKLDVSDWYLQQIGWEKTASGLMVGVVAQSKLGFGLAELVIRGAVLGAVLAFIHRQCVRHASSLTSFIIYLWLCTSIYYTYRASTFYIATWAVYRVVPFVLMFWLFNWLFRPRAVATAPDMAGNSPVTD
jgi:hypothetical protein